MEHIDLTGQVAVVTGAGRGLGRAYGLDFARRGASVVVNDVSREHAEQLVREIRDAGGAACAAVDSVATADGARRIVAAAVEHFGGVGILVNNAGFLRNGYLEDLSNEDFDEVLAVHARGAFLVTQAAWPHMRAAGYGRVVMAGSAGGMLAMPGASNYCTAKAALHGLTRALAQEGERHGIRVNMVLPRAATDINATRPIPDYAKHAAYPPGMMDALAPRRSVDAIVPLVSWLASGACSVNGETFSAAFGRYARVFVGITAGWIAPDTNAVTAEDIGANMEQMMRMDGFSVPRDLFDEVRGVARALGILDAESQGFHEGATRKAESGDS